MLYANAKGVPSIWLGLRAARALGRDMKPLHHLAPACAPACLRIGERTQTSSTKNRDGRQQFRTKYCRHFCGTYNIQCASNLHKMRNCVADSAQYFICQFDVCIDEYIAPACVRACALALYWSIILRKGLSCIPFVSSLRPVRPHHAWPAICACFDTPQVTMAAAAEGQRNTPERADPCGMRPLAVRLVFQRCCSSSAAAYKPSFPCCV